MGKRGPGRASVGVSTWDVDRRRPPPNKPFAASSPATAGASVPRIGRNWRRARRRATVAFCDVEITGLAKDDRIVSFGGIGMISSELAAGQLDLRYSYLVFNPGKKNHRHAEQVHGFSDLSLRFILPASRCPQRSVRLQNSSIAS